MLGATLFAGTVFAQEKPSQEGGFGDWFVEIHGNYAWSQNAPFEHISATRGRNFGGSIKFESSITGGSIAVGRTWDRFRFSLSYLNRSTEISETNAVIRPRMARVVLTGDWNIEAFMANAYYDLPFALGDRVRPYIGLGAGAAHADLDYHGEILSSREALEERRRRGIITQARVDAALTSPRQIDGETWYHLSHNESVSHRWKLAWHISAGVNIELNDTWTLLTGYRYMGIPGLEYEAGSPGARSFIIDPPSGIHFMEFGVRYSFSSLPWWD